MPRAQKIWGRKKLRPKKRGLKLQRTYHRLASHERSTFVLKRVKTGMRYIMESEKLNSLMSLCSQNDIAIEIDYNDVINDFAMIKARRKSLLYTYNDSTKNKDA
ncbi:hypothetical protein TNCV_901321 [Trichonephila clavipes]|nr:hypothetical protein TNCV_901321 [Trichonephila clavipes]